MYEQWDILEKYALKERKIKQQNDERIRKKIEDDEKKERIRLEKDKIEKEQIERIIEYQRKLRKDISEKQRIFEEKEKPMDVKYEEEDEHKFRFKSKSFKNLYENYIKSLSLKRKPRKKKMFFDKRVYDMYENDLFLDDYKTELTVDILNSLTYFN